MLLTLKKKSPVTEGVYTITVQRVEQLTGIVTQYGLRDKIRLVFTVEGEAERSEIISELFWSDYDESPYAKFVKRTAENFGCPVDELDTDIFLNRFVRAKISTYKDKSGNEYPTIEWLAPPDYTSIEEKLPSSIDEKIDKEE